MRENTPCEYLYKETLDLYKENIYTINLKCLSIHYFLFINFFEPKNRLKF